jgi:hypothetical protein
LNCPALGEHRREKTDIFGQRTWQQTIVLHDSGHHFAVRSRSDLLQPDAAIGDVALQV